MLYLMLYNSKNYALLHHPATISIIICMIPYMSSLNDAVLHFISSLQQAHTWLLTYWNKHFARILFLGGQAVESAQKCGDCVSIAGSNIVIPTQRTQTVKLFVDTTSHGNKWV